MLLLKHLFSSLKNNVLFLNKIYSIKTSRTLVSDLPGPHFLPQSQPPSVEGPQWPC